MTSKHDKDQDAMLAVAKHPFEKGLLDHISEEMKTWAYFLGNNDAANKVMAAIIVKAADEFRNSTNDSKVDLFNPDTYIKK